MTISFTKSTVPTSTSSQPSVLYPILIGVLLGTLQTGLFFQLTFTLSSGFNTYLMVTLSWIFGSALGVTRVTQWRLPLFILLGFTLIVYGVMSGLLLVFPFNSRLWVVYAGLVILAGVYPGVFFARMSAIYTAKALFFWENNGFILGIVASTLLFMLYGRAILWWLPLVLSIGIMIVDSYISRQQSGADVIAQEIVQESSTPLVFSEINEA